MLQEFGQNLWIADGAEPVPVAGFRYPLRMAVARLPGGGLWLWSPVQATGALMAEVAAFGPVTDIVAPNGLHHLFLAEWQAAFPEARLHAAPGLARKRPDLRIDRGLGHGPDPDWGGAIDQQPIRGCRITTEVLFFHAASATVLVTDLIQSFPAGWFTGWRAWVARADLMTAPAPTVPRKFRLAFTDRTAARRDIARALSWPAERLVMAHGAPVERGGQRVLANAFGWLGV